MKNRAVTVLDVADYFLSKQSMTHRKLERMCYYAQAWYLANYGIPLFHNRFEAWIHGPVSPDLYVKYKQWGWLPIAVGSDNSLLFDPRSKDILDKVYDTYGHYDDNELSLLTQEEMPWIKARQGYCPMDYSRQPISMQDMKTYYGEIIGKK